MEYRYSTPGDAVSQHGAPIGAAQAMREYAGLASSLNIPKQGELEAIISRIRRMEGDLEGVGSQLQQHADAVFGGLPALGQKAECQDVRTGLVGEVHDALDQLERALRFVTEQASRNCSLA